MTLRKLCGLDVNGWRDISARNWRLIPGEEEEVGPIEVISNGPLTSVVLSGNEPKSTWIGGPQAQVAPHGLGDGWGEVGKQDRRIFVRSLLDGSDNRIEPLSAAFSGMGGGAACNVVAIDDDASSTELFQEHILTALGTASLRNAILVWRPVLAALYALDKGLIDEGQKIGVICHSAKGISVQSFNLRHAHGSSTRVVAPERRVSGRGIEGDFGYASLVRSARQLAIGDDGLSARTAHRAFARCVGRFALGLPSEAEVVRRANGDWEIVDLSSESHANFSEYVFDVEELSECDVVLFETLTEGILANALSQALKKSIKAPLVHLETDAVALGALIAAQRLCDGDPIYFDFLPRISTIVFSGAGASNFDLIREDETLEAGRLYRSPVPAELAIPPGQNEISVFLRKSTDKWPRKAKLQLSKPLANNTPVSLWVEQKPAAGRARILMEARELGQSFTLDWEHAQIEERAWDEIIESLDEKISIPARLVLPCGLEPWEDSNRADGLLTLLKTEPERVNPDWDTLAATLAKRPFGKYCISSDGNVPDEIASVSLDRFEILTERALDVTQSRLRGETGRGTEDNAALKFLTWQFRRCPSQVADWLIDCVESSGKDHPFVNHQASWVLVYQGLGRIVNNEATERRAVKALISRNIKDWVWNRQSAGMAFMLSRSDSAPLLLERDDVERIAQRVIADFERNLKSEYTTFIYAPFLMAGLMRWRLKVPTALVAGLDPLADNFRKAIDNAIHDLQHRKSKDLNFQKRRDKYLPILRDLREEVLGNGTNPDLLLDIYHSGAG